MRRYTATFMEWRIGAASARPMEGTDGHAVFDADDDTAAVACLTADFADRVQSCSSVELSSMALIADPARPGGVRAVDDCLTNPYYQDLSIRVDARTKQLDIDFESTRTALISKEMTALLRATR